MNDFVKIFILGLQKWRMSKNYLYRLRKNYLYQMRTDDIIFIQPHE